MTSKRQFTPPPKELVERWVEESKSKPTIHAAYGYITYKAAKWAHDTALDPDPNSLKQQALKGLERIQRIDVVSVWIGKDVFDVIKRALEQVPDGI